MTPVNGGRTATRDARLCAVAIVVGFIVVATVYSVVTPIWEAPDEVGHMAYVMHLVQQRALPVQRPETFGEEHQPPLYYLLAAVLVAFFADLHDPAGRFRFNRQIVWGGEGGSDVSAAVHGDGERFPLSRHRAGRPPRASGVGRAYRQSPLLEPC